jgi:ribosomal protein L37AE/L43A
MSKENQVQASIPKFCPICGDTMHLEDRDAGVWLVCDDVSCDYQVKP